MSEQPREETQLHTRILKCALEVEDSRAYWAQAHRPAVERTARHAFEESWFGSKSLARIEVLFANLRARFDAYPHALQVLNAWTDMDPETRKLVCHWHLQLADPLYRRFTGEYLVQRRLHHDTVTRDLVVRWVGDQAPDRWTHRTLIQFGSKLLSAARSAGLVTSTKDPRPLAFPRVGDAALTYLLYLLRGVDFAGTLLANPYLASVGLDGAFVEDRLRKLNNIELQRQGDLVDFSWSYPDLQSWASATVASLVPSQMTGHAGGAA